jgi:hypothetical protein
LVNIEPYFNWCHASGSNNKQGSPDAEEDPMGICTLAQYQDALAPRSVCAEDPVHLNGTTVSVAAKGGLGKLAGATTDLVWWLPSIYRLRKAYEHGADRVLPRSFTGVWTSTMDSYNRRNAWVFEVHNMLAKRSTNRPVICIGAH